MDKQQTPIKNIDAFIYEYGKQHPDGHFFDHDTLKFFGERISEMRLLKGFVTITDISGEKHVCYMISSRQRKCPGGPRRVYHYFDKDTLDHVILP